jgi:hypothetical protein
MKRTKRIWVQLALISAVTFFGVSASALFAQERELTQAGQGSDANKKLATQLRENIKVSMSADQFASEPQKAETARAEANAAEDETVTKTYTLRYVSFREVADAARLYIYASSGSVNTITVRLPKKNVSDFEALLRKLDVEKKNVMFRVYTIIAARDNASDIIKKPETKDIDNRDLKIALDELKGLWSFKHYWVDAPSFLTVTQGMLLNRFKLVSSLLDYADFDMHLVNVRVSGDEPGKRIITVGGIELELNVNTPSSQRKSTLIDTKEISLKEKGYLIVGVSGLETGWNGLALILVISAEIK